MISQKYKDMLQAKSVIREMSAWANQRGAEIGYENVFDYSLGNPSVPVPQAFTDKMIELCRHGMSWSFMGTASRRESLLCAQSLPRISIKPLV